MISKTNKAVVEAYKKGYRVINGKVFYKNREVAIRVKKSGYYGFCIRMKSKERYVISVHRLVGYQKFGKKIFKKHFQIRHLDSNCLNNNDNNIGIGNSSDNNLDKHPDKRRNAAIIASSYSKKHNHEEIIKMHNNGLTYKQIMEKLNIKSKGTISFIINKSMALEKTKKTD